MMLTHLLLIAIPHYGSRYHISGVWTVVYSQMRTPIIIDTDKNMSLQSEISFGRMHTIRTENTTYTFQTNATGERHCEFSEQEPLIIDFLPSENLDEWFYEGKSVLLGKWTNKWSFNGSNFDKRYFFVSVDTGFPVRYEMYGDSIRYGHPTHYILDIYEFSYLPNTTNFIVPAITDEHPCINKTVNGPSDTTPRKERRHVLESHSDFCKNVTDIDLNIELPDSFSWRDIPNIVPNVRDQGSCGSCWAQSSSEAISAQFAIAYGNYTQVSSQQVIDCVWTDESTACTGGEGYDVFYVYNKSGIKVAQEDEYPYLSVSGFCQKLVSRPLGRVVGCELYVRKTTNKSYVIKRALYKHGPLMVYMKAGFDDFIHYTGGPFDNSMCSNINSHDECDHGVLLTGWKMINGSVYYEIMNSWSTSWGDQGFAYISVENDCGISVYPLRPLVELEK